MTKYRTARLRDLEQALKAAADPTRTRILKLLEPGGLCVCQIQAVLGLAPSTISKHLSLLKAAGLVDDRREGRWIVYALSNGEESPLAADLLAFLRPRVDRDPAILADRARLKEVRRVSREDLCALPAPDRRARPASGERRTMAGEPGRG